MLTHWKIGTWDRAVDRFIVLSEFARGKMIEGGLPADKIAVKPNFLDRDPGFRRGNLGYFAFVGRLSEEKGVSTLLECWKQNPDLPLLRIVGTGPLQDRVQEAVALLSNVEWMGSRSSDQVLDIMGGALALLCPSLWYEGMPRVVVEALGVGTPVIASRLGTYVEMIERGAFGELFPANDIDALAKCLRRLLAEDAFAAMRAAARREFEQNYSGSTNFAQLHRIYESVLSQPRSA
jgi:glycosyltransferase involved in cell wall biosynthesis